MKTLTEILGGALYSTAHPVGSTDGDRKTGTELIALADRIAASLKAKGVTPNEPVLVRIGNRPSDLGALLGVWRAGAVAAPVHVAAAASTFERLKNASGARFCVDGEVVEELTTAPPPARPLLDGAALIMFTSGTTGEPKGAVVAHERLADKLTVLDRLLGITAKVTVLLPLQMTFIFGLWVALLSLMKGARVVLVPKFSSAVIAQNLAPTSILAGVPSIFRTLLADGVPPARGLRMIMTGGEVFPAALAQAVRRFAPDAGVYDLYGLTETGTCDFCLTPAAAPGGFGSIGRPTERVQVRIAADGELQIRSPFAMLGYLDNPQLTAASYDSGYFKTGDLARMRPDGLVELIGRAKEIISRGGSKIAPLEIDNLLMQHPQVLAALCAGVPDDRLGEVVHAVIVPRAGQTIDEMTLRDWLLARTERYKVPEVFYFRDVLPVGSTGKGDRRAVARLAHK
jgi:acyl-CoA synthetase (AMP-forming)/AMP-acid ligase II